MPDRYHNITKLILKDLAGKLNSAGKNELQAWLNESEANQVLYNKWQDDDAILENLKFYNDVITGNLESEKVKVVPIYKPHPIYYICDAGTAAIAVALLIINIVFAPTTPYNQERPADTKVRSHEKGNSPLQPDSMEKR